MVINQQEQQSILEAFSSTHRREAHVLSGHPNLLWQQYYNRLQWIPDIKKSVDRVWGKRLRHWLRDRRPYRESSELIRTLKCNQNAVTCIALSPDNTLLVSTGTDGTIKIWDFRTGVNLQTLHGHKGPVLCCAIHPDGKHILSGGRNGELKLWQAETAELLFTLVGSRSEVTRCAIDPTGQVAASGGVDGKVNIWDLEKGEHIRSMTGHSDKINDCVFSPDGFLVASASSDRTVRLWDWASGESVAVFEGHRIPVTCCRISPDGKKIISATHMAMRVWEINRPHDYVEVNLSSLEKSFSSCDISPDGSYLVLGTDEGLMHVLSGGDGRNLQKINKEYDSAWFERVWSIGAHKDQGSFSSPDNHLHISGPKDYLLRFFADGMYVKSTLLESEFIPAKFSGTLSGHSKKVTRCLVCADGRTILSGSEDGTIKIWEINLNRRFTELTGNDTEIEQCQYSPDGKTIYSSGGKGILDVIDASSGEFQTTFRRNRTVIGEFHKWALDPQGYRLVSADVNRFLKVWDAGMQREIDNLSMKNPEGPIGGTPKAEVNSFVFSPDGQVLITLSKDISAFFGSVSTPVSERIERSAGKQMEITVWDMVSGKKVAKHLDDYLSPGQVCIHPNGRSMLVKHRHGIQVCDVQTAKPIRLIGDEMLPNSFQIAPDGKRIIVSVGNYLQVWDFESGKKLHALRDKPIDFKKIEAHITNRNKSPSSYQPATMAPLHWLTHVAVSPLGDLVAGGTDDGWVTVWDLASGEMNWQEKGLSDGITALLFSPDGDRLISAQQDNWMRIWEVKTGRVLATYPFLGETRSVQCHPYLNQVLAGDTTGTLYLLDLIGKDQGAIIAHPFDANEGFLLHCPACGGDHSINNQQLGKVFTCTTQGCGLRMMPKCYPFPNPQPQKIGEKTDSTTKVKPSVSVTRSAGKKSKPPSITGRAGTAGARSAVQPATQKAQFESYRRAAEKGDPNAQMMLGTMYASGKGVPRDLKKAASWYRKAAEAGNASAQMLLGSSYFYGNGVIKDVARAVELYKKAAQAGNRMAQYRLGECYAKGTGVPHNEKQAVYWYQKAADQNFSLAKTKLRALKAKKEPSHPVRSTTQPSRTRNLRRQKPTGTASDSGKINSPGVLGKQAAALRARGDLNGALKLYKEQEKILRGKKDLRALNINLSQQSIILKELLKDIDGKIQDKLRKRRGRG